MTRGDGIRLCRQTPVVFVTMEPSVLPSRKRPRTGINCMVPGCTNYRGKDNTVQYHRIPADKDMAQQWLRVTKLANPPKLQYARLCSAHFTDDCYELQNYFDKTGKFVQVQGKEGGKLKKTAVPSLFYFSGYRKGSTDAPTVYSPVVSARSHRQTRRLQKREQSALAHKVKHTLPRLKIKVNFSALITSIQ